MINVTQRGARVGYKGFNSVPKETMVRCLSGILVNCVLIKTEHYTIILDQSGRIVPYVLEPSFTHSNNTQYEILTPNEQIILTNGA